MQRRKTHTRKKVAHQGTQTETNCAKSTIAEIRAHKKLVPQFKAYGALDGTLNEIYIGGGEFWSWDENLIKIYSWHIYGVI